MKTRISSLFIEFLKSAQASGVILLFTAGISLMIANSALGTAFQSILHTKIGIDTGYLHLRYEILHWINDGLMAVFFLMIGLEIERELYIGELSDLKNAFLPVISAMGGMLVPALIYLLINLGKPTQNGFGIPMATDIAFALGALTILGDRVASSVKVFLAAFAIIDDLGAILVIALFYAEGFSLVYFILALAVFALLVYLNRRGVDSIAIYLPMGVVMWYLMLQSGVHASVAGVLLAFAIPFRDASASTPSSQLLHFLNKPVALVIMPLFALANTGILVSGTSVRDLLAFNTVGIFSGLFVGKPLGIILFALLAIKLGWAKLPHEMGYTQLLGVGFLGGIGFTMSIFITILAFGDTVVSQTSKIAILVGSFASAATGIAILSREPKVIPAESENAPL